MKVVSFLLIVMGIFQLVSPQTAWYLSYGWRYKNAEPSDIALVMERMGGVVAIIVGIIILIKL